MPTSTLEHTSLEGIHRPTGAAHALKQLGSFLFFFCFAYIYKRSLELRLLAKLSFFVTALQSGTLKKTTCDATVSLHMLW